MTGESYHTCQPALLKLPLMRVIPVSGQLHLQTLFLLPKVVNYRSFDCKPLWFMCLVGLAAGSVIIVALDSGWATHLGSSPGWDDPVFFSRRWSLHYSHSPFLVKKNRDQQIVKFINFSIFVSFWISRTSSGFFGRHNLPCINSCKLKVWRTQCWDKMYTELWTSTNGTVKNWLEMWYVLIANCEFILKASSLIRLSRFIRNQQ